MLNGGKLLSIKVTATNFASVITPCWPGDSLFTPAQGADVSVSVDINADMNMPEE